MKITTVEAIPPAIPMRPLHPDAVGEARPFVLH
jgi:hypothetical protein